MEQISLVLTIIFTLILSFKYLIIRIRFGINPVLIGKNKKKFFVKILETTPIILTTLLILLILQGLFLEREFLLTKPLNIPTPISYLGVFLGFFSFYFLILGYYHLGLSWRIGVSNQMKTPLITTGIFSITRNPVYISFYLFSFSLFLISKDLLFLSLSILLSINLHLLILQEEKSLEKTHGRKYLEYKKKVPRYF